MFGWAKDKAGSIDANTLEAATSKSTATIIAAAVTDADVDTSMIKTLDGQAGFLTTMTLLPRLTMTWYCLTSLW